MDRTHALPEPEASSQTGSPLRPLALAGALVLALAAVWALASLVPAIHYRDALVLNEFTALDTARSEPALDSCCTCSTPRSSSWGDRARGGRARREAVRAAPSPSRPSWRSRRSPPSS